MLETFTLSNAQGMVVTLANYDARIISIKLPLNGRLVEMTVAPTDLEYLIQYEFYIGAICGPV